MRIQRGKPKSCGRLFWIVLGSEKKFATGLLGFIWAVQGVPSPSMAHMDVSGIPGVFLPPYPLSLAYVFQSTRPSAEHTDADT